MSKNGAKRHFFSDKNCHLSVELSQQVTKNESQDHIYICKGILRPLRKKYQKTL